MQNPQPLSQNLHHNKISRDSYGPQTLRSLGFGPRRTRVTHRVISADLGFFFPRVSVRVYRPPMDVFETSIKVKFIWIGVSFFLLSQLSKQTFESPNPQIILMLPACVRLTCLTPCHSVKSPKPYLLLPFPDMKTQSHIHTQKHRCKHKCKHTQTRARTHAMLFPSPNVELVTSLLSETFFTLFCYIYFFLSVSSEPPLGCHRARMKWLCDAIHACCHHIAVQFLLTARSRPGNTALSEGKAPDVTVHLCISHPAQRSGTLSTPPMLTA